MIVPPDALSPEALDGLIKEYCLRDWGLNETEQVLEQRKTQVEKALRDGELIVWYSEHEESAHLLSTKDLPPQP